MALGLKPLGGGQAVELLGDDALERRRRGDVAHLTAVGAQEVVVVLGQVFGQLEPSELVVSGHSADDPGRLEVEEVPVGGASRKIGEKPRSTRRSRSATSAWSSSVIYPSPACLGRSGRWSGQASA
jgi:hypothetical protein